MSTSPFDLQLSSRARRRRPSPIRELMPYMAIDGMISLGGGYPHPATFPFRRVEIELDGLERPLVVAGDALQRATQYGPTPGTPGLLSLLRAWQEHKDGVCLPEGGLMVLNGSQEGLYLLADVLLDDGDELILSEPSYPGALAAFRSFTDRLLAVPLDAEGIRVEEVERLLAERVAARAPLPRVLYVIPCGHNPGGVTLSLWRRQALVALARRHDLLLIEDDPYQLVRLDPGERLPTLQRLAPERVVRLDSFSKILCPGLRLGYASGPPDVVRAMLLHKQASNLHTSTFSQVLLEEYLGALGLDGLLQRIAHNVRGYREKRDRMLEALAQHLPDGVRFRSPDSGLFLWLDLPAGCDGDRMIAEDCEELGVLLVPGSAFSTVGGCRSALRASFSLVALDEIDEAAQRLGEMVRREVARTGAEASRL